jgi:hypothetical protein
VIGGSLLLDSFRSMFGHGHAAAGAYEPSHSPWDDRRAADSELAREAGGDDINHATSHDNAAGLVDTADTDSDNDGDYDDGDVDGDFDGGDYDGGDVA